MLPSLTLHWRPRIPVRDLKLSVFSYLISCYSFHIFISNLAKMHHFRIYSFILYSGLLSHNSYNNNNNNKKPWHALSNTMFLGGKKKEQVQEKERRERRSTCGELKNEQGRGTTAWTRRKLRERQADRCLSPRGRLHRIHTMRDRNMAAAHFFPPLIIRRHIGSLQEERR